MTGSGDIAPGADGPTLGYTLIGTLAGVVVVIVVAVTFATDEYRSAGDSMKSHKGAGELPWCRSTPSLASLRKTGSHP